MHIDTTRLTRDYTEQPLGKLEKPAKEDLEYLFKELNMTVEDLTKYFNKGKSSVGRWLTKYDIKKGTPQTKYVDLTQDEINSVDLTRMSRDFQAKPWVPHKDTPVESDFRYLYLELNWSGEAIATYLGVSTSQVRVFLRNFGITKDSSLKAEVKEKELQRKYGVSHVSHIEGVKEKKEQTCLKNHGVKYILEKEEVREGRMEEVYGNKHALCVPELKKKQEDSLEKTTGHRHLSELQELAKEGVMKKYNVDNVFKLPEFQEKAAQTKIQFHGTSVNMHVESIKNKVFETNEKVHGFYGSPFGSKQVREKAAKTTLRNWGVDNALKSPVVRAKARQTLLNNIRANGITAHPSYSHVLHKEHFNKEYWLEHFVDHKLKCFNVGECAAYHGVRLNCINQVMKVFGIDMRHKRMSIQELNIREYIASLGFECKSRDKSVLKPKELDILLPEEKLAIEYDGIMYHSQGLDLKYGVTRGYHLSKTKGCEQQGIQLLHIFENEWLDPVKNDIWKSVISHKLGCNSVIYARNTVVREISSSDCYAFCEQNHLQGGCRSSKNLGLFTKDNELVAIMSFRKPRFNPAYDWELIRYCSKKYVSVVGGASKLLKHFRKLNSGSIISYANRRWSTGDLYEALGFSFVRETAPNYFYYKTIDGVTPENLELHSRLEFQKHKLASKLEHFDANKSEFDNMYQNGYRSIYDCGNLVYVLK